MDEKKIDNEILEKKKIVKDLEDKIDEKKAILKEFKDIEYGIGELGKSINRCIDLLNDSIRGEKVQKILDTSRDINLSNMKKMMSDLDDKRNSMEKEVKKIEIEREKVDTQKE